MLFVFLVALAARVVLAVGVYVAHDGALFADDAYFQRLARDMADGDTSHWAGYDRAIFYATSTFLWPLTLLARLVSPGAARSAHGRVGGRGRRGPHDRRRVASAARAVGDRGRAS